MHELALTEGIINIINSQQEQEGFSQVLEIRLRVGEYSGIVPDCIREFFPIAAKGTAAERAELVIDRSRPFSAAPTAAMRERSSAKAPAARSAGARPCASPPDGSFMWKV